MNMYHQELTSESYKLIIKALIVRNICLQIVLLLFQFFSSHRHLPPLSLLNIEKTKAILYNWETAGRMNRGILGQFGLVGKIVDSFVLGFSQDSSLFPISFLVLRILPRPTRGQ